MIANRTTATIGQIQSCFFSNKRVRDIVRPKDVWPNVMWACAPSRWFCERRNNERSQFSIDRGATDSGVSKKRTEKQALIDASFRQLVTASAAGEKVQTVMSHAASFKAESS